MKYIYMIRIFFWIQKNMKSTLINARGQLLLQHFKQKSCDSGFALIFVLVWILFYLLFGEIYRWGFFISVFNMRYRNIFIGCSNFLNTKLSRLAPLTGSSTTALFRLLMLLKSKNLAVHTYENKIFGTNIPFAARRPQIFFTDLLKYYCHFV